MLRITVLIHSFPSLPSLHQGIIRHGEVFHLIYQKTKVISTFEVRVLFFLFVCRLVDHFEALQWNSSTSTSSSNSPSTSSSSSSHSPSASSSSSSSSSHSPPCQIMMGFSAFQDAKATFLKQGVLLRGLLEHYLWKPLHLTAAEFNSIVQVAHKFEVIVSLQSSKQEVELLGSLSFALSLSLSHSLARSVALPLTSTQSDDPQD